MAEEPEKTKSAIETLKSVEKKPGISDPFYLEWSSSGFALFPGDI